MPERMKPYRVSCALMLLLAYLGVQALTGERGLLSGASRDSLLDQRETQLAHLANSGATWRPGSDICVLTACRAICWRNARGPCWAFPTRATM